LDASNDNSLTIFTGFKALEDDLDFELWWTDGLTALVVGDDASNDPKAAVLCRTGTFGTDTWLGTIDSMLSEFSDFLESTACSTGAVMVGFVLVSLLSLGVPALAIFAQEAILAL
jgi:hypothetical protein